ncbi:S8 family serine peptidase [Nonomuraea aurantiaca]|uniref:S8 family serine peptidase n=1 Tax=Nonomuraea aurantiaca TaxID=2878562 RepID=UPI001CDA54D7|nr:S8 family serine peptidase [Nonomuraea aurantiaca]MCA2220162.1 S8 family serine peptidase [Nonomuraea aurantiaca]
MRRALRPRRPGLTALVVAAGLAVLASTVTTGPAMSAARQVAVPSETVTVDRVSIQDGRLAGTSEAMPLTRFIDPSMSAKDEPAYDPPPPVKISQQLSDRLDRAAKADTADNQRVRVLVTFTDDEVTIPQFPESDPTQPKSAAVNVAAAERSSALVSQLTAQREPGYRQLRSDFHALGGEVLDTYWLIKGVRAEVPLAAVPALAQRDDVLYVQPAEEYLELADTPIGDDGNPLNDPTAARDLLRTKPWQGFSAAGERIGLIDTGVRASHKLLSNPSHLGLQLDLANPGAPNPDDDCRNHGTKSAAVLTGNSVFGEAYRGVTDMTVDSYKILPAGPDSTTDSGCHLIDPAVAVKAFQQAAAGLDKVIVAPIGSADSPLSSVSLAADHAFEAGSAVIAAQGNSGPGTGTAESPGNARKVMAIGAVDMQPPFTPYEKQSRGPVPQDGRIKPDVVGPTNVVTATNAFGNGSGIDYYTATSAATALVGGMAATLRNVLRTTGPVQAGEVYAGMIAAGSHTTGSFDNVDGAGKLALPTGDGIMWKTKVQIHDQESVNVTIKVPTGVPTSCRFTAALWWPDFYNNHHDIDLQLIAPDGTVRATSQAIPTTYELARINGPVTAGTWTLRVKGFSIPTSNARQDVYVAASTCR